MAEGLILETSFLVDLERELSRREAGPAQAFLERNAGRRLFVTFTISGELAAGHDPGERDTWRALLAPFRVLPCTDDVCWRFGQTWRYLSDTGLLVGAADLWIAATALAFSLPLVTRDERLFRRVPGLDVRSHLHATPPATRAIPEPRGRGT